MLFHTSGINYKNGRYLKTKGLLSKHFICNNPAYAYPLFKTHKLSDIELQNTDVEYIPTRLLQSTGQITKSHITAFLEIILQPISVQYCSLDIREHCKDSKHYLMELQNWKENRPTGKTIPTLFINTADVRAVYPSVNRDLTKAALKHALNTITDHP